MIARFGGEEFAVILPNTPLKDAIKCAERIRRRVAKHLHNSGHLKLMINVSIGVAEVQAHETSNDLIRRTDEALYAAKGLARNHPAPTYSLEDYKAKSPSTNVV